MYGSPVSFFFEIFSKRSIVPAPSKRPDIISMRLVLTKFSISCLSTLVPMSFSFNSDLIESITSVATSDSKRDISSSNKISSMSFSFSSFSPKLLATFEKADFRLSNIMIPIF